MRAHLSNVTIIQPVVVDVTETYRDMLDAFSVDFELAKDDPNRMDELKGHLEGKTTNEQFMHDIELLSTLAFGLRHDLIMIMEVTG